MLRFPDVYTRLHALTKADNLGLGFIVTGLAVHHGLTLAALKLLLIWLLVLLASGLGSHLIADLLRRTRPVDQAGIKEAVRLAAQSASSEPATAEAARTLIKQAEQLLGQLSQ